MSIVASDACERTVAAGGVGTMDLPAAGAYTLTPGATGDATRYSCDGHNIVIAGVAQGGASDTMSLRSDAAFGAQNQDFITTFSLDNAAAGNQQQVDIYGRFTSANGSSGYQARVVLINTTQAMTVFLDKVVAGTSTSDFASLGSRTITSSYTPGTQVTVEIICNGSTITVNAYLTAAGSASAVTLTTTDTSILGEGGGQWRLNMPSGTTGTQNLRIASWSCNNTSYTPGVDTIGTYGISFGHIQTYDTNLQQRMINTVGKIVGSNGYFRTGLTTTNTDGSFDSNLSKFDQFCTWMAAAGLKLFPFLQLNNNSGATIPARNGLISDPVGLNGMMGVYTFCYNIVRRYGPGGTFSAPGWSGIRKFEVWNEPQTASGNAGRTDDASGTISTGFSGGGPFAKLDMLYSDYAEILRCACLAIRQAASDMGFTAYICGFACGGIDTSWIKGVVDWCASNGYTNPLTLVDAVSYHVYSAVDPATLPAGTYPPGTDNPVINVSGQGRNRQYTTIGTLRQYLDASTPGGTGPDMFISEDGYRGHDMYNVFRTATLANSGNPFSLPAATIPVTDTSQFSKYGGNLFIQPVTTTTAGTTNVTDATQPLVSSLGFAASGSVTILNTLNVLVPITYTGISGNTLTGCTSTGTGTIAGGTSVTGAPQVVAYTHKDATHFKGCTGGSGTLADATVFHTTTLTNIFFASPDAAAGNADQETWNLKAIETIQQHNSYWRVKGFITYGVFSQRFPINTNDTSDPTGGADNFITDCLGIAWDTSNTTWTAALPARFWKPAGVGFSRRLAEYGLNTIGGSGTPAGTLDLSSSGSSLTIRNGE